MKTFHECSLHLNQPTGMPNSNFRGQFSRTYPCSEILENTIVLILDREVHILIYLVIDMVHHFIYIPIVSLLMCYITCLVS